jgi:transcriptional regulator with XRE-family HTH domain
MEIAELLKSYRKAHNASQSKIAGLVGVSLRTYQAIEETGVVKKSDVLSKIHKLLNTQKIAQSSTYIEKRRKLKNSDNEKPIPVFESAPTTLTTVELYRDEKASPDYFIRFAESIPQLKSCDYATRATGDSMHPFIRGGSINFGRQIFGIEGIILGEVYIVHTKKGQETIKYIQQHPEKEDWFLLIPHNPVAKNTPILKSDIIRIFEWKGALMFP